jgi:hypothetical protein
LPLRSPRPALNRRSQRWFETSPCRATPEDLPPSLTQHRFQKLLHQRLLQRSWHTTCTNVTLRMAKSDVQWLTGALSHIRRCLTIDLAESKTPVPQPAPRSTFLRRTNRAQASRSL